MLLIYPTQFNGSCAPGSFFFCAYTFVCVYVCVCTCALARGELLRFFFFLFAKSVSVTPGTNTVDPRHTAVSYRMSNQQLFSFLTLFALFSLPLPSLKSCDRFFSGRGRCLFFNVDRQNGSEFYCDCLPKRKKKRKKINVLIAE